MILDSEISVCPEFEVKSKTGKIFKKHSLIEKYSVRIYELILIFVNIIKKIKLIKMVVNIFYLELIFILANFFEQQKLIKKDILTDTLFLKKKGKQHQKKNLIENLLELIQVKQKMAMIQIMRLVMQKHLLMSLKTDNQKNQKKESNRK